MPSTEAPRSTPLGKATCWAARAASRAAGDALAENASTKRKRTRKRTLEKSGDIYFSLCIKSTITECNIDDIKLGCGRGCRFRGSRLSRCPALQHQILLDKRIQIAVKHRVNVC